MAKLSSLAVLHESLARTHRKIAKLLLEMELGPELEKEDTSRLHIHPEIEQVWERLLDAWAMHRFEKTGKKPNRALGPSLTPERMKLIRAAINRHGVEKVKRAAIGLYLSSFHTGQNDTGKEYLEPERPFQIKSGKDMVEVFAQIYMEAHREI